MEHSTAVSRSNLVPACVWLTGLSGSGKSTTATALNSALMNLGVVSVVLDGDDMRHRSATHLGFSKADRDTNVLHIATLARESVVAGIVTVCAAISPYRDTRQHARDIIGSDRFIEIFVDTPVEICESRDPKGLYALARRGDLKCFTGVDDPYEPPNAPQLVITTVDATLTYNVTSIIRLLLETYSKRQLSRRARQQCVALALHTTADGGPNGT